jgi:hypothetical protein
MRRERAGPPTRPPRLPIALADVRIDVQGDPALLRGRHHRRRRALGGDDLAPPDLLTFWPRTRKPGTRLHWERRRLDSSLGRSFRWPFRWPLGRPLRLFFGVEPEDAPHLPSDFLWRTPSWLGGLRLPRLRL